MKLRTKQLEALEWLATSGPWKAAWWGGRPHGSWPKQMGPQTYNSLSLAKLIRTENGRWAEKEVFITAAGVAVIAQER